MPKRSTSKRKTVAPRAAKTRQANPAAKQQRRQRHAEASTMKVKAGGKPADQPQPRQTPAHPPQRAPNHPQVPDMPQHRDPTDPPRSVKPGELQPPNPTVPSEHEQEPMQVQQPPSTMPGPKPGDDQFG